MDRFDFIEERACTNCIHYDGCLGAFRDASALGLYDDCTEEEYFSDAGTCAYYADSRVYIKQGGWISVEERLPDLFHTVLVYDTHTECVRFTLYKGKTDIWTGGRITHWMPLPEAPKMKGCVE